MLTTPSKRQSVLSERALSVGAVGFRNRPSHRTGEPRRRPLPIEETLLSTAQNQSQSDGTHSDDSSCPREPHVEP